MKNSAFWVLLLFAVAILVSGCAQPPANPPGSAANGGPQQQERLWLQKATEEKNPVLCENIDDNTMLSECLNSTITAQTTEQTCAQFTDQQKKDKCYNTLVNATKNTAICENISDTSMKQRCQQKWQANP
jgi:hypothetical protein